jgi:cyclophilin family peptidyl-prolyl cis-trans isomerase/predicted Ser/Thr protein kinase
MDESASRTGPATPGAARCIGPYRVVREIGRGGMGAVYLCEDTAVGDRPVALKVVLDPQQGQADALERFKREIRNLGKLRHRNIVQVLYAGEHEGRPYFVMEYVPGRDLNRRLEEISDLPEPQRIAEIVRLVMRVCEGVAHAHRSGTTHRDLKPQNILVREDGEPMILDFGIAKHREDASITSGGFAPGTPSFMAPEQFDAGLAGEEAQIDVWGLGAILYVALTRDRPFKGPSLASVAYHVVHTAPIAPRKLNPAIPERLEAVVQKALEKDPRRRYATADALREALGEALKADERAHRRRRAAGVAAGVAAAAVLVVAFVRPWERTVTAPDAFATLVRVEGAEIAFGQTSADVASFDPTFTIAIDGVRKGAALEAALSGEDGRELARVTLAPAGNVYEASFRTPPGLRRDAMRAYVTVYADREKVDVRPSACRFTLDATSPQLSAKIVEAGTPREWPADDASPPSITEGATLEVRAYDKAGIADAECSADGVRRVSPDFDREPLQVLCDVAGEHVTTVRVSDPAGNLASRSFRYVVVPKEGAASSRAEAASRPAKRTTTVDLPLVPGSPVRFAAATDFSRPVPLEPRDGVQVMFKNLLGPFELEWKLRLRDGRGEIVAECVLEPKGLLESKSWANVAGALNLARVDPTPPLRAEFFFRDAAARTEIRTLEMRFDWRAERRLAPRPRVRFKTTLGDFVFELDRSAAPEGVTTFLAYVEADFFADTLLHDVRKNVSVMGGRYTSGLGLKPLRGIPAAPNGFGKPGALKNVAGTVSLAHDLRDLDSGRAAFVINLADQPDLDAAKYTVIGRVAEGLETLKKISAAPAQKRDALPRAPKEPVIVKSATEE